MIAPALLASTAIILLSFVSEDAATISSALSIFGGPITWPLGFAACFAGIWLGDLGFTPSRVFSVTPYRFAALPPEVVELERHHAIFPREPTGGTWISANDAGVCLALINWHRIERKP